MVWEDNSTFYVFTEFFLTIQHLTGTSNLYNELNIDVKICKRFCLTKFQSSLCEKCPNTEFILIRIFPYSDWVRRFTVWILVFSHSMVKYGPEKTSYLDTFHAVFTYRFSDKKLAKGELIASQLPFHENFCENLKDFRLERRREDIYDFLHTQYWTQ